jgi:DNA-binding LacI/PurR family transcriptional regulator
MENATNLAEKRATIQDIARMTGVSVATVSGALSGKRRMSERTRAMVLARAKDMGFTPNPLAQRLITGRCANKIAVLTQSDLGVATQTMWQLMQKLAEEGFEIQERLLPAYIDRNKAMQVKLIQTICHQNPAAILCAETEFEPTSVAILSRYTQNGGILVRWADIRHIGNNEGLISDNVLLDTEMGCFLQARHLIELGHRKLGFFGHGGLGVHLEGFKRALSESDIDFHPEWVGTCPGYEEAGIKHAEQFLAWKDRPTGVCIINDNAAAAFINGVVRSGLEVPSDVSVVGYDDTAAARAALVPLTTFRRPVESLCSAIVDLLCKRLHKELVGPPCNQVVQGELVIRQSTAPPREL